MPPKKRVLRTDPEGDDQNEARAKVAKMKKSKPSPKKNLKRCQRK
jgi:hypothetical protein